MRRLLVLCCLLLIGTVSACGGSDTPDADSALLVEVYKSPTCRCCQEWADHLVANGFKVKSTNVMNLSAVKQQHGVPADMQSCHTALVSGYIIEGHVPASDIERLLRDRPAVRGLAAPGMPQGSPGMETGVVEPYTGARTQPSACWTQSDEVRVTTPRPQ